jgi:type IV pilus modification protein PilV
MTRARSSRRRSRAARGFTLIEVVVALGVMVVGVMGVIAMQQQTIMVNSIARQRSVATQIAQTWIDRLKQDALMNWTQAPDPIAGLTAQQVIGGTAWLSRVNMAPNVFQQIPQSPVQNGASNAFDFRGNEIAGGVWGGVVPAGTSPWFCVSFRPAWVYVGRALRVDVRVFWPRPQSGANVVDCVDVAPAGALPRRYMSTYLSTVLKYAEVR